MKYKNGRLWAIGGYSTMENIGAQLNNITKWGQYYSPYSAEGGCVTEMDENRLIATGGWSYGAVSKIR